MRGQVTQAKVSRIMLADKMNTIMVLRNAFDYNKNLLLHEKTQLYDSAVSMASEERMIASDLAKLMKLNVMNDCFYVWFSGPFGTINNFRLGRLPSHAVDWSEINAALGEATLAVFTMQMRIGLNFKRFQVFSFFSRRFCHCVRFTQISTFSTMNRSHKRSGCSDGEFFESSSCG